MKEELMKIYSDLNTVANKEKQQRYIKEGTLSFEEKEESLRRENAVLLLIIELRKIINTL